MLDGRFKAPQEPKPSTSVDKVKLRVADQYEWYIDKTTLTEKSKFFGTMLSGGWQEDVEGVINLPEDEPDLVARMVLWARYGKYPSSPQVSGEIGPNLVATNNANRFRFRSRRINSSHQLSSLCRVAISTRQRQSLLPPSQHTWLCSTSKFI